MKKSTSVDPYLEKSIEIWARRAEGKEDERNCPLCEVYDCDPDRDDEIEMCPVQKKTGRGNCRGTPYWDYVEEQIRDNPSRIKGAAQEELDFLESLREVV